MHATRALYKNIICPAARRLPVQIQLAIFCLSSGTLARFFMHACCGCDNFVHFCVSPSLAFRCFAGGVEPGPTGACVQGPDIQITDTSVFIFLFIESGC